MLNLRQNRRTDRERDVSSALEDLSRLAEERPSLKESAALLGRVLPSLFSVAVRESAPAVSQQAALDNLRGGVPLLRGETIKLDGKGFRRRWRGLCTAYEAQGHAKLAHDLASAARRGNVQADKWIGHILAGDSPSIRAAAEDCGLDAELAMNAFRLAMFPVLSAIQELLLELHDGVGWQRGYCPTCGCWPLLSELRGLEQIRWLRCGLCAAEWEFSRLQCPYCGCDDHRRLGFFHVDGGGESHRAATCDACGGYVKSVATLAALSAPGLLVADAATLHLDLAAVDSEYGAPTFGAPR